MTTEELETALADMTDQRDRLIRILEIALREPAARRLASHRDGEENAIAMVEKAFLGSILSMPTLFEHVKYRLSAGCFSIAEHGDTWEAISKAATRGVGSMTTWLIAKDMEPRSKWAVVALSALLDHAILDETDIPIYAKTIRDASIARRIK